MRFFVLLSLVAVALADKLPYNYQPVAHSDEGLSQSAGISSGEALLSQPLAQPQPAPVQVAQPAVAEFEKEFYTYSAPEHEFDDAAGHQDLANSVKKSLRVVFVRTPENRGLESAALNLAKSASDDKTAIYILTKQADIGNLAQQLQALKSSSSNKPDVHFVKYRTEQDVNNAKQAIQSQYDSLPGTSRNSNEGTAPVLNFASRAPVQASSASLSGGSAGPGNQYLPTNPVSQQYLPPSLLRYRI